MGFYPLLIVLLLGFFAYAALYHLVLWVFSRREVLLAGVGLECLGRAVLCGVLLALVSATTVEGAEVANRMRYGFTVLLYPLFIWNVAQFTGVRRRRLLWTVTAGCLLAGSAQIVAPVSPPVLAVGPGAAGRSGLPQMGLGGSGLAPFLGLILSANVFALVCAARHWRVNRIESALLAVACGLQILGMLGDPLQSLFPQSVPWVPGIAGGVPWVLVMAILIARRSRRDGDSLRESEERYRVFVDNATDAFFIHDVNGTILDANERACESLGYTHDELVGMTPLDYDPVVTRERLEEIIRALDAGTRPAFETRHRRKDGSVFPVEVKLRSFLHRGGRRAISITRDVSERKRAEEALRASEEQLRVALTAAAAVAFVWDVASDAAVRYFSTVPSLPMNVHEPEPVAAVRARVHPDDVVLFDAGVAECLREGTEYRNLYRVVDPGGSVRWLQEWGHLARDAAGRPLRLTGISIDVTDRKQAEAALRESEERYRLAVRATNDAVWDIDVAAGTVHWSEKYASAFGRPPETADSWQWWIDRIHPDDRERTAGSLRAAVDGAVETWACDYRFRLPSGEWADIRDRAYIARDPAGKAVRVVGAMLDVTAFRRAAADRDRMWNLSLDPMCLAGFDGYFKQVNPAFERALGRTTQELTSRPWLEFVHPDDRHATQDVQVVAVGGKMLQLFENRYQHQDGTYRWLSWNAYPAVEQQIVFCIARDVTEQKRAEAAQRASEERFRRLIEDLDVGVILQDAEDRVLVSNPTAAKILGLTLDQLHGVTSRDPRWSLVREDGSAFPLDQVPSVAASRSLQPVKNAVIGSNHRETGDRVWLQVTASPQLSPDGALMHVLVSLVDITARKQAEAALRASEERLRLALSAGRMGIFDWDLATNAVVWSDTHYELFGYPAGERAPVEYRHFADRVHPDDLPAVEQAIRTAMDLHSTYKIEHRLLLPGSTIRWIQGTGEFQYDSEGRPVRMLGTVADVTDRKQAETELVMRDRAIQAVNQGIVITDPNLRDNPIVYVSPGFERLTGYSSAEVVGRNCRFLQGPDTDKAEIARLAEAIRAVQPCAAEFLNYRKDGSKFWNELSITPVRDPDGRLVHFVGIQTDVTTRRSLEDQLRQAQKMEAVGQLAGGVAHDFNNLLTVINGYCELLLLGMSADHPMRESMTGVRDAGERAAALTQQLLAFSRRTIVAPRVLDVNDLVGSGSRMLRRLIGEDVTLVAVLSPSPCLVRIDPGQLEQAVMNLAVNARDAMPRGGRLTLETDREEVLRATPECPPGRYVRLAVTDTGTGITDEVKARIFEPFFTTKGAGKGTGLGLAMVYGLVHQAGGCVRVESAVGRGTTFTLLLPEVQAAAEDRPADGAASVAPGGSETVLLAEDEDAVRTISRLALEMQGYTVVATGSGAEAVAAAGSYPGPIHLLVTDVVMPDLGGRELADEIRRHRPAVRVLYVSGYTNDAVVRHGIEEEVDAFLQKPFTPLTLARKVREVLDASRTV